MLFTDIYERQADEDMDETLEPLRRGLREAKLFVFDEQAVAMAANVAYTRPSSIIASLPFVKLPAPSVWIEFANHQLRSAMTELGSQHAKPAGYKTDIERSGFLLRERDGTLIIDYARRARFQNGETLVMTSLSQFGFDVSTESNTNEMLAFMSHMVETKGEEPGKWENEGGLTGKVAQYHKKVHSDMSEAVALKQLSWRFGTSPHPEHASMRERIESRMGAHKVQMADYEEMEEAYRLFTNLVLPGLILLNCRNAVEREVVPAPDRLNKQRQKKGRPPIEGYQFVKMHLTARKKRLYASRGMSTKNTTGGIVIGHFKVRQSGIYWWNPHWRGPDEESLLKRVYVATP